MTDLSPTAQAVMDAADIGFSTPSERIAAALRAAADQVVPPALEEEFFDRNHALPLQKMVEIRLSLLAIAAELEVPMAEHPITPPPELVEQWRNEWIERREPSGWVGYYLATQAARWGADTELEACVEWLREARNHGFGYDHGAVLAGKLRADRLPKPPSLAEQALALIDQHEDGWRPSPKDWDTIRRALGSLDD